MDVPNFRFTCPKCHRPIVVVWKFMPDSGGDFPFNLDCQHCNWRGSLPLSQGEPIREP